MECPEETCFHLSLSHPQEATPPPVAGGENGPWSRPL